MESATNEKKIKNNVCRQVSSDKCCGCSACYQICHFGAIKMTEDEYGCRVPAVDDDVCVECGMCLKTCPILHSDENRNRPIGCYAATNKSLEESFHCSSGGIFTAIAEYVINEGGIVCGATFADGFRVRHIMVDNMNTLNQIKKSKYVQSDTTDIYKKVKAFLAEGRYLLFSGTPCQVRGLYTFLGLQDHEKLLTVDVVCHGVPSQLLFDDYISHFRNINHGLDSYTFRAKRKARNGMKWFFSFDINEKKHFRNWPEDSYNYYYMMGKTYRESCYSCPFASVDRVSDITLCDYWSWEKYHVGDFDELDCVSGVLLNTHSGKQLFEEIKNSIVYVPANLDDIVRHNGCLVAPTEKPSDRDSILRDWQEKGYAFVDDTFRKKYKMQRMKYAIMRQLPDRLVDILARLK